MSALVLVPAYIDERVLTGPDRLHSPELIQAKRGEIARLHREILKVTRLQCARRDIGLDTSEQHEALRDLFNAEQCAAHQLQEMHDAHD